MDVRNFVISYFRERGNTSEINDEELLKCNYIDAGLVDSISIAEMIVTFEEHFGFDFNEQDLESDRFQTVSGLLNIIEENL